MRIVDRLRAENAGHVSLEGLAPVFREIISGTRSSEAPCAFAYLGPEGTFLAPGRARAVRCARAAERRRQHCRSICRGRGWRAQLGIVPVEDTTEGVVTQTLARVGEREVTVCAERVLRVSTALLSKSGQLADVRRVISHPQPLAQCRRWLDQQLPGIAREEMASTAAAAERAAGDSGCAAIGSLLSAEVYGLAVAAAGIEDRPDNTRLW